MPLQSCSRSNAGFQHAINSVFFHAEEPAIIYRHTLEPATHLEEEISVLTPAGICKSVNMCILPQ